LSVAIDLLNSGVQSLQIAVCRAYYNFYPVKEGYKEEDINIIDRVLKSSDEHVVSNAIDVLFRVLQINKPLVIDFLKHINIGISTAIADKALQFLGEQLLTSFKSLSEEDVNYFLEKLIPLEDLDEYWIENFLANASQYYATQTAKFFMTRTQKAVEEQNWHYKPSRQHAVPLRFRESTEFSFLLGQISNWIEPHTTDTEYFYYSVSALLNTIFYPLDHHLLSFLSEFINKGNPIYFRMISTILYKAPSNFVFEHKDFVVIFLERMKKYDNEFYQQAVSDLCASATCGMKHAVWGKPYPEDIKLKDAAEKVLQDLARSSPAYPLYKELKKHAEQNIKRCQTEHENFE